MSTSTLLINIFIDPFDNISILKAYANIPITEGAMYILVVDVDGQQFYGGSGHCQSKVSKTSRAYQDVAQ